MIADDIEICLYNQFRNSCASGMNYGCWFATFYLESGDPMAKKLRESTILEVKKQITQWLLDSGRTSPPQSLRGYI